MWHRCDRLQRVSIMYFAKRATSWRIKARNDSHLFTVQQLLFCGSRALALRMRQLLAPARYRYVPANGAGVPAAHVVAVPGGARARARHAGGFARRRMDAFTSQ